MRFAQGLIKRLRAGFTTAEILIVVAIIAILLGVAIPSVITIQANLKFTEYNATARELFIAAQNNLTSLKSADKLTEIKLIGDEQDPSTPYLVRYIDQDDPDLKKLLPAGAIDSTVTDNKFVLIFNVTSGTVLDAFYYASSSSISGTNEALALRASGSPDTNATERRKKMLGYYNGSDLNVGDISLDAPTLTIKNGNTLSATISFSSNAGGSSYAYLPGGQAKLSLVIESVTDSKRKQELPIGTGDLHYPDTTIILDKLHATDKVNIKSLLTPPLGSTPPADTLIRPGEQVYISARITYIDKAGVPAATSQRKETNTLFATRKQKKITPGEAVNPSGADDVIELSCERHLQNLNRFYSGFEPTQAFSVKQLKRLDFENKEIVTATTTGGTTVYNNDYIFLPIVSDYLALYDGSNLSISNVQIGTEAVPYTKQSEDKYAYAGLFCVTGEKAAATIKNVQLVNAMVRARESCEAAGSLIGQAMRTTLENCLVYANDPAAKIEDRKYDKSFVRGSKSAGGLIGEASGCTIKQSSAGVPKISSYFKNPSALDTEISASNAIAGGLIGTFTDVNPTASKIESSYADVDDLSANGRVAMFIGHTDDVGTNTLKLDVKNCYATGNISKGATSVCGFFDGVEGSNTITVKTSYAAVSYLDKIGKDGKPLNLTNISGFVRSGSRIDNSCKYLSPSGATTLADASAGMQISYGELSKGEFLSSNSAWTLPGIANRILLTTGYKKDYIGASYPFPMLVGPPTSVGAKSTTLRHYGCWPVNAKTSMLVYYETYADGSAPSPNIGVHGITFNGAAIDYASFNVPLKGNDFSIAQTGYAVVALSQSDTIGAATYTAPDGSDKNIPFASTDADGKPSGFSIKYETEDVYFYPLQAAALDTISGQINSSKKRSVSLKVSVNAEEVVAEFNPAFAASIAPKGSKIGQVFTVNNPNSDNPTIQAGTYPYTVRTEAQLHNVRTFQAAHDTESYGFRQSHSIRIKNTAWTAMPAENMVFDGSFDGSYESKGGVAGDLNWIYDLKAPLFSTISNASTIRNTRIDSAEIESEAAKTDSIGILALVNGGTVDGCTVKNSSILSKAGERVAAFIAKNEKDIENSQVIDVTVNAGSVNATAIAAGFVAENSGKIERCNTHSESGLLAASYARNAVVASAGSAYGFVGLNDGEIINSSATGTVTGKGKAAGFVGTNTGSINQSYSNCKVIANVEAAGFAFDNGSGTINSCYTMLDLRAGKESGIAYGFAKTGGIISNSYSANRLNASKTYAFVSTKGDTYTNNYYLAASEYYDKDTAALATALERKDMTTSTFKDLLNKSGTGWELDTLDIPENEARDVHPYDLINLSDVPMLYPKLDGVAHYGDWPQTPLTPSGLIYYEEYEETYKDSDGTVRNYVGMYGRHYLKTATGTITKDVNTLRNNNYTIKKAGYGIMVADASLQDVESIECARLGSAADPDSTDFQDFTSISSLRYQPKRTKEETFPVGNELKGNVLQDKIRYSDDTDTYSLWMFTDNAVLAMSDYMDYTFNQYDTKGHQGNPALAKHLSLALKVKFKPLKDTSAADTPSGTQSEYTFIFSPTYAACISFYSDGDPLVLYGTKDNPAQIRTTQQLSYIKAHSDNKILPLYKARRYFHITHNVKWVSDDVPVTYSDDKFSNSVMDGKSNVMNDDFQETGEQVVNKIEGLDNPMFGTISDNSEVKNLIIAKSNINSGGNNSAFITYNNQSSTIDSVHVIDSTLTSNADSVGGFVVYNSTDSETPAIIRNCSITNSSINSTNELSSVGGFAKSSSKGTIEKCFVDATITAGTKARVAGFITNNTESKILNCYSKTNTLIGQYAAGFVENNSGIIDNCIAESSVVSNKVGGNGSYDGNASGFVNINSGTISNSYCGPSDSSAADISVTGDWDMAGFVLRNSGGTISKCATAVTLAPFDRDTNFYGFSPNQGTVTDSYYRSDFNSGAFKPQASAGDAADKSIVISKRPAVTPPTIPS